MRKWRICQFLWCKKMVFKGNIRLEPPLELLRGTYKRRSFGIKAFLSKQIEYNAGFLLKSVGATSIKRYNGRFVRYFQLNAKYIIKRERRCHYKANSIHSCKCILLVMNKLNCNNQSLKCSNIIYINFYSM